MQTSRFRQRAPRRRRHLFAGDARPRRRGALTLARRWLAFGACACLLGFAAPAQAAREMVDRIVAMVDDESILLSDVLREMNLVRLQRSLGEMSEAEQEQLFRTVLDGMIDDQLLVAQAKVKGYEVGEQELSESVDKEVRSIKERLGGEEAYRRELQRQGFTEAEVRDMHREQRRKQILASRVVQNELRPQVSITADEVRQFYDTQRDSVPAELLRTPVRVRLADILIIPRDEEKEKAARAKMDAILQRLQGGEDFAKVATEQSEWPTAKNGGSLGKFRYGDFESDAFDEAVSKLEPGQMSPVIPTKFGLMVVKLESRDGEVMTARHIVIKIEPDENARVNALERALDLRRRALAGEDFAALARQYSDDPLTKEKGGMVEDDWDIEGLRPEFRGAVDSLAVGEISNVLNTPNGFYVLKILERNESKETTFEEIREPLHRYMEQRELEKLFQSYVHDLRKKFFVDVKV
ncbi:MAG TPA: peptidylprolyl isomerase [Candidatus Krumholzibacteria bacterium]|nr:peptidylprolyl isomerase [Candidatus Krumholzibacteria bacterium]